MCPVKPRVTLLNLRISDKATLPQIQASACDIPFPDSSFDIVFSNSMIEHLGTWEKQALAAKEMRRVGKRLWIQTPNSRFPIEPHYLTPFIHWFPSHWQRNLLPYTVWAFIAHPTSEHCDRLHKEIRLLNWSEMRKLFPDCSIKAEHFIGLTKSIIVIR